MRCTMRNIKRIMVLILLFLSLTIFIDEKNIVSVETEYDKKFNYVADTGCIANFGNITVGDGYTGSERGFTSGNDDKWQILNENNGLITYTWGLPEKEKLRGKEIKKIEKISYEITDKVGGEKCSGDIPLSSSSTKAFIEFHVTKPTWKYVQLKAHYSDGSEDKIDGKILVKVASTKEPPKLNNLVIEKTTEGITGSFGTYVIFKPEFTKEHDVYEYGNIQYNAFASDGSQVNNNKWSVNGAFSSKANGADFSKTYKVTFFLEPKNEFRKEVGAEATSTTLLIDFSKLKDGANTCVSNGNAVNMCSIERVETGTSDELDAIVREENDEKNEEYKDSELFDEPLYPDEGKFGGKSSNSICDDEMRGFIRGIWNFVYGLAPIALILFCTIDFVKAMASNDAEAIKKAFTNSMKRIIAGILLLALPLILRIILGWFGIELCM